jgi:5'-nucleotidase
MAACNFPFLLSNVIDRKTGTQLAGARRTLIVEHAGLKLGFMGVIEEEWLATLACIEPSQVQYTDYVAVARELEPQLRAQGCDLVIALTHSRVPNDNRLAREVPALDLILGGHDHDAYRALVNGVPVIKSGTDFRELTRLVVTVPPPASAADADAPAADKPTPPPSRRCLVEWQPVYVKADVPEDPQAAALVTEYGAELEKQMEVVIAELGCDLDFKFAHIRTQETNGANFIADAMRAALRSAGPNAPEVAMINSGTLRAVSPCARA